MCIVGASVSSVSVSSVSKPMWPAWHGVAQRCVIFKQKLHDIYPACFRLIFRSLLDPREVLMQFKGEHVAPSIDKDTSM